MDDEHSGRGDAGRYACESIHIVRGLLTAALPRNVVRTDVLDPRSMDW